MCQDVSRELRRFSYFHVFFLLAPSVAILSLRHSIAVAKSSQCLSRPRGAGAWKHVACTVACCALPWLLPRRCKGLRASCWQVNGACLFTTRDLSSWCGPSRCFVERVHGCTCRAGRTWGFLVSQAVACWQFLLRKVFGRAAWCCCWECRRTRWSRKSST